MEKQLIFHSAEEVKFKKVLTFIIPTYLTSLFNTVYTIVDGMFVSSYVGTNALAAINIVYPVVNVLTGIGLAFAAGGSAVTAIQLGGKRRKEAGRTFSVCISCAAAASLLISALIWIRLPVLLDLLGSTERTAAYCRAYVFWWLAAAPVVTGKEILTYFIRADGSPAYSFLTAFSGGILNILLDYILVGCMGTGIQGAALATVLGLLLSFFMGLFYFISRSNMVRFTKYRWNHVKTACLCAANGTSELINQLAIAATTIVFNRTAMNFAGEDGVAAVSIIMYLQFLFIGIYFGCSMGIATPLGYAHGNRAADVCRILEVYACRFFGLASPVICAATFLLAPFCVSFFAETGSEVYTLAVSGMRIYGLGFLFAGINIFSAIRMMAYGKGQFSGMITFLRSFALLLLFLLILPDIWGIDGVWAAVPAAEMCTLPVSIPALFFHPGYKNMQTDKTAYEVTDI